MLSKENFVDGLVDAYENLYDLVRLRNHALTEVLVSESSLSKREKAWRLHHLLLDIIEELNPGPQARPFSREWRRHRLMVLRFREGYEPKVIAEQLAISLRHYYREQRSAINVLADILWERVVTPETASQTASTAETASSLERIELLRKEAAYSATLHSIRVEEVLEGVLALLDEKLTQRNLRVEIAPSPDLPDMPINRNLLRQMLLGLLGYFVERMENTTIRVSATSDQESVWLTLSVNTAPALAFPPENVESGIVAFQEIAASLGASLTLLQAETSLTGFQVKWVVRSQRTILVVDDNEDVLELMERYLRLHGFRVLLARSGREAIAIAQRSTLYAVVLDLMMPEQDGWDVLKILLQQETTRDIPVIVCSILKQQELAFLMGAAAFVEKPVTEQSLLAALNALEET